MQRNTVGTYKLCTDCSKTEQGIAFAVYSENFSTSNTVSNCTSIFTAELYRFLEVTSYSVNVKEEHILLASDSKSLIKEIRTYYPNNLLFQKIL